METADDLATLARTDYAQALRDAVHALTDLNEAVNAKFGIMAWERFDYDLGARTLTFSHKGRPRVTAEIQLSGPLTPSSCGAGPTTAGGRRRRSRMC